MTSAHCTKGEDHVFVPAYHDGEAPFGIWTIAELFASQIPLPAKDVAALVVDELDGQTIQDVVGSQGIAFDAPMPERINVFAFPRERINTPDDPYGGTQLIHSAGPARVQETWGLIGTSSDMSRGASGGALLADFDPATGYGTQVAVVSGTSCLENGDDGQCAVMEQSIYGAPFTELARSLYEQAAAA